MSAASSVSWLFVPGDRPDRFAKAAASGADEVILDLEDAVPPARKQAARDTVADWLESGQAWVRVNAIGTDWHKTDLEALRGRPGLRGVVVPKAEHAADLDSVGARLGCDVVALIESALGVHRAVQVAAAPSVARLALGAIDLALDLDCSESDEALLFARSGLVLASRLAGLPAPIDGVTVETTDTEVVTAAATRARSLGFGAKLCIHPAQLAPVTAAFAPSDTDVDWARSVLAAARNAAARDGGAVSLDGQMVDKPVIQRAERVLSRAGQ